MVKLPHHKHMILRVSPDASLAAIFQQVVSEKQLDPYRCELRHPTQPDTPLSMASPLKHYRLTEIDVVEIGGGE
jgi:hypothetical protein